MNQKEILDFLNTRNISKELAEELIRDYADSTGKKGSEVDDMVKFCLENPASINTIINKHLSNLLIKFKINFITKNNEIICYYANGK